MSQHSAYYHREQSLASTIINMSQNFGIELSPITRYLFPKDDVKLLKYLNEDGQSIEPNWYMPVMPVIPMVLVNGSEEIDDVLNSFIPNYNPREIIVNIRRLLNGEEVVPMDPWYKGFKGSIVKSAKEGDYVVNGTIEEVDEQTFRITELPIGMWTQDYKQFLLSVTDGTPDAKDILIEDFRQNGDDATVDILVRLKQDKIMAIKQEGLLKKFELTRTISTSNMYLFDAEGKIKKYDNPENTYCILILSSACVQSWKLKNNPMCLLLLGTVGRMM